MDMKTSAGRRGKLYACHMICNGYENKRRGAHGGAELENIFRKMFFGWKRKLI